MYFLAPIVERLLPLPTRITPPPSPPEFLTQRVKLVAHRRGRDRQVSEPGENSSGDEEWRKRSKMPRMRMHADDEEEKRDRRMKRVHRNRWIIFILLRMAGSCNYEVYVWRHKPVCGSWQKLIAILPPPLVICVKLIAILTLGANVISLINIQQAILDSYSFAENR